MKSRRVVTRRRASARSAIAALALTIALAAAATLPATGTAAAKSPFEPGLYVGKTSQGYPVKLRLTLSGEPCGGKPCMFAPSSESEIYIAEPCQGEGSTNEYLALFGDLVTSSGTVHANQSGFSKTIATLKVTHHGSLTGKVRASTTLENGTKCDSGPITLTAKIGGSTK
ncbi:MAG TPA: hypothetical protein VGG40_11270 [Solirubrobacterales bacterium]|jgi:hypothetical protein